MGCFYMPKAIPSKNKPPSGSKKGGKTASENAVQPPKFYILIIAYNF